MGVRSIKRVLKISESRDEKTLVICSAIRQLRPIEFYYLGGFRTVEPFALGLVLNNDTVNQSLVCWQTAGFSDLLQTEGWKLYRVADMEGIEVIKEHFTGDRPGYGPESLQFHKIICCITPVSHPVEEVICTVPEPPQPKLTIESSPVRPYIAEPPPPPPAPVIKPQPVIRYITHNELMERFRYAHPLPIRDLDTTLWEEPLASPFPELEETKPLADKVTGRDTRYLVGQTA
jgi:hypothetical protein